MVSTGLNNSEALYETMLQSILNNPDGMPYAALEGFLMSENPSGNGTNKQLLEKLKSNKSIIYHPVKRIFRKSTPKQEKKNDDFYVGISPIVSKDIAENVLMQSNYGNLYAVVELKDDWAEFQPVNDKRHIDWKVPPVFAKKVHDNAYKTVRGEVITTYDEASFKRGGIASFFFLDSPTKIILKSEKMERVADQIDSVRLLIPNTGLSDDVSKAVQLLYRVYNTTDNFRDYLNQGQLFERDAALDYPDIVAIAQSLDNRSFPQKIKEFNKRFTPLFSDSRANTFKDVFGAELFEKQPVGIANHKNYAEGGSTENQRGIVHALWKTLLNDDRTLTIDDLGSGRFLLLITADNVDNVMPDVRSTFNQFPEIEVIKRRRWDSGQAEIEFYVPDENLYAGVMDTVLSKLSGNDAWKAVAMRPPKFAAGGANKPTYPKGEIVYYSWDKTINHIARIIGSRWSKSKNTWEYKLRNVTPDGKWIGEFPNGLHTEFTPEHQIYGLYKDGGDIIAGGKADKKSVADIAKLHGVPVKKIEAQLRKGEKVELEHTKDKKLAEEIAKDHLVEFADYYDRLEKMESREQPLWLTEQYADGGVTPQKITKFIQNTFSKNFFHSQKGHYNFINENRESNFSDRWYWKDWDLIFKLSYDIYRYRSKADMLDRIAFLANESRERQRRMIEADQKILDSGNTKSYDAHGNFIQDIAPAIQRNIEKRKIILESISDISEKFSDFVAKNFPAHQMEAGGKAGKKKEAVQPEVKPESKERFKNGDKVAIVATDDWLKTKRLYLTTIKSIKLDQKGEYSSLIFTVAGHDVQFRKRKDSDALPYWSNGKTLKWRLLPLEDAEAYFNAIPNKAVAAEGGTIAEEQPAEQSSILTSNPIIDIQKELGVNNLDDQYPSLEETQGIKGDGGANFDKEPFGEITPLEYYARGGLLVIVYKKPKIYTIDEVQQRGSFYYNQALKLQESGIAAGDLVKVISSTTGKRTLIKGSRFLGFTIRTQAFDLEAVIDYDTSNTSRKLYYIYPVSQIVKEDGAEFQDGGDIGENFTQFTDYEDCKTVHVDEKSLNKFEKGIYKKFKKLKPSIFKEKHNEATGADLVMDFYDSYQPLSYLGLGDADENEYNLSLDTNEISRSFGFDYNDNVLLIKINFNKRTGTSDNPKFSTLFYAAFIEVAVGGKDAVVFKASEKSKILKYINDYKDGLEKAKAEKERAAASEAEKIKSANEAKMAQRDVIIKDIENMISRSEIGSAFVWEGSAWCSIKNIEGSNPYKIQGTIGGSSGVEHEGDVGGIRNQIYSLKSSYTIDDRGNPFVIEVSGLNVGNIQVQSGERYGDSDYEAYAKADFSATVEVKLKREDGGEVIEQADSLAYLKKDLTDIEFARGGRLDVGDRVRDNNNFLATVVPSDEVPKDIKDNYSFHSMLIPVKYDDGNYEYVSKNQLKKVAVAKKIGDTIKTIDGKVLGIIKKQGKAKDGATIRILENNGKYHIQYSTLVNEAVPLEQAEIGFDNLQKYDAGEVYSDGSLKMEQGGGFSGSGFAYDFVWNVLPDKGRKAGKRIKRPFTTYDKAMFWGLNNLQKYGGSAMLQRQVNKESSKFIASYDGATGLIQDYDTKNIIKSFKSNGGYSLISGDLPKGWMIEDYKGKDVKRDISDEELIKTAREWSKQDIKTTDEAIKWFHDNTYEVFKYPSPEENERLLNEKYRREAMDTDSDDSQFRSGGDVKEWEVKYVAKDRMKMKKSMRGSVKTWLFGKDRAAIKKQLKNKKEFPDFGQLISIKPYEGFGSNFKDGGEIYYDTKEQKYLRTYESFGDTVHIKPISSHEFRAKMGKAAEPMKKSELESGRYLRVLPDDLMKYFRKTESGIIIPMSQIVPTRARESGIINANKYMWMAYNGQYDKRKPVTVRKSGDKYEVLDGNSTYANAKISKWRALYAEIGEVSHKQGGISSDTKKEKAIVSDLKLLAQMAKEAERLGQKAPTFNLCEISLPDSNIFCNGNKGIDRVKMPQLQGKPMEGTRAWEDSKGTGNVDGKPAFIKALRDAGHKMAGRKVLAESLKATQNQLIGEKVAGMMEVLRTNPKHPKIVEPIFISTDGYVLDGHHRWAAQVASKMATGKPIFMDVIMVDMNIDQLLKFSDQWAKEYGIAQEEF